MVLGGLKSEAELVGSPVVANNAMNRERVLRGRNGYARELGFDPLDWLRQRPPRPVWVDLCCGSGRALADAARVTEAWTDVAPTIVGVDLIEPEVPAGRVEFVLGSATRWEPPGPVDLVTCVHGLHYVGDKLGLIARAAGWLRDGGRFVANLDLDDIDTPADRQLGRVLRAHGFGWHPRQHRLTRVGPAAVHLPYDFVGADDAAGPNYTGQPSVRSVYRASAP